jgi:hypothetical protein
MHEVELRWYDVAGRQQSGGLYPTEAESAFSARSSIAHRMGVDPMSIRVEEIPEPPTQLLDNSDEELQDALSRAQFVLEEFAERGSGQQREELHRIEANIVESRKSAMREYQSRLRVSESSEKRVERRARIRTLSAGRAAKRWASLQATENPGQREARLAKRRENYRKRKVK